MTAQETLSCFHCHLAVPRGFVQSLHYQGKKRHFCCMGCYSIAETIIANGLDDYYKFRTTTAPKAESLVPESLQIFDQAEVQASFTKDASAKQKRIELLCSNLQCSACSWLIEKRLQDAKGVIKVTSNITEQTIMLEWDNQQCQLSELLTLLHELGYPAKPYRADDAQALQQQQNKLWLKRLGLAGLGMMQVMMYAVALYIGAFDNIDIGHRNFLRWVSFLVATPVLLYSGFPFFQSAYRALKNRRLNMDVPIAIALVLAYVTSIFATLTNSGEVYFDSVTMFVFFLLIGRFLEYRARQKVRQQFWQKTTDEQLLVTKFRADDPTQLETVPLQTVTVGDRLLVKPGATLVFDGLLVKGQTSVNEAMLSGEFLPVNKQLNDTLLAGSVNGDNAIEMEVTHLKGEGFIQRLKQLQKAALLDKPKITLVADKVARYFVAVILLIASISFAYWWLKAPEHALWITISVLVVSCPCALSLATPVALTCGVLSLNRRNFLIQDQDFLQKLEHTTDIVFDKTGTLTQGELEVQSVSVFTEHKPSEVLAIIAAMESQSEHPIAQAFTSYAKQDIVASDIQLRPYAGVSARYQQETLWFGNQQFISENTQVLNDGLDANGLFLANNQQLLAKIILGDRLRDSAKRACAELHRMGKKLHLLSGDPSDQVEKLAQQLAIDHWQHQLTPQAKLDYLKKLQAGSDKCKILTVGDGINDAPAMAVSDTSIAMAGASDLTKSHADSYLLSADLNQLQFAIDKSAQTNSIIKQNLTWALCYNLIMIPFAVAGLIPPYLAAIGMSLSSVVVVINSLRLNPKK
ncbi:heavy metal translocating P-type ATPase [Kangiella sp. TOML190]|uniref:heavy metal translocating P-type ATPase n=1 Tax=Kangiella sp. TOML190 TaxID=2931351 RepID=UPI00203A9B51|nr:heavy metal translocating P-type ATPase [Kangiella sp. TOML190]